MGGDDCDTTTPFDGLYSLQDTLVNGQNYWISGHLGDAKLYFAPLALGDKWMVTGPMGAMISE